MFAGFAVLAALLWRLKVPPEIRWHWEGSLAQVACVALFLAGSLVLAVSRISLDLTRVLYVLWMSVTRPVGIVAFGLGLTLFFFTVLPVFALLLRRSDPLRRRASQASSYWEPAKPYEPTVSRMARLS